MMNIKTYVECAIENLEYAMSIIEEDNNLNNGQNEDISKIYQKLSASLEILENIYK